MKPLIISIGGLLVFGVGSLLAKGGSSNPPPPPAPAHHSASAPAAISIGGGVSHNYSAPYRPVTVSGNGQRTLVYPGVRNSTIHQPTNSTLNGVRTGGQQASGKLHSPSGIATINKTKLDPQTSTRLRNWSGGIATTAQAHQNHVNNCHHHHDHNWWKHHCVALIFFDWGWWGWDDGWWYPAWGYDPYSNYEYNEPIYGDLAPEQIIAGVQTELQRRGYYMYAIDGKMGPLTRAALNRYQTDRHMNITSGIDPATLNSLGIVH